MRHVRGEHVRAHSACDHRTSNRHMRFMVHNHPQPFQYFYINKKGKPPSQLNLWYSLRCPIKCMSGMTANIDQVLPHTINTQLFQRFDVRSVLKTKQKNSCMLRSWNKTIRWVRMYENVTHIACLYI